MRTERTKILAASNPNQYQIRRQSVAESSNAKTLQPAMHPKSGASLVQDRDAMSPYLYLLLLQPHVALGLCLCGTTEQIAQRLLS